VTILPLPFKEMYFSHLGGRESYQRFYDETYKISLHHIFRARSWMKHFDPEAGATILELGCGTGGNLIHYAALGFRIEGVEISRTAVEAFGRHLEQEPEEVRSRIQMTQGWIEDFEPTKPYDYVILAEVLEHVIDPVAVMNVGRKSLSDTGEVYITAPTFINSYSGSHVRVVYPRTLEKWTAQAGLRITWIEREPKRVFCKAVKA